MWLSMPLTKTFDFVFSASILEIVARSKQPLQRRFIWLQYLCFIYKIAFETHENGMHIHMYQVNSTESEVAPDKVLKNSITPGSQLIITEPIEIASCIYTLKATLFCDSPTEPIARSVKNNTDWTHTVPISIGNISIRYRIHNMT